MFTWSLGFKFSPPAPGGLQGLMVACKVPLMARSSYTLDIGESSPPGEP